MDGRLKLPSRLHDDVADEVVSFFADREGVHAILVVASCARGMALPESDLDVAVLVAAEELKDLEREWEARKASSLAVRALSSSSLAAALHLDLIDGVYEPVPWDDGGGPDDFELGIGNQIAYASPILERGEAFADLQARWLPFYDEELRSSRLAMVRDGALLDLDFVPFYVRRELYFQAFDRLYKSFREFMQGLFIARRTYPICYTKWIRHQVCDLLEDPELYAHLPAILEVPRLEGDGILRNAAALRALITERLY